jgi:hypothetical protein
MSLAPGTLPNRNRINITRVNGGSRRSAALMSDWFARSSVKDAQARCNLATGWREKAMQAARRKRINIVRFISPSPDRVDVTHQITGAAAGAM